MNDKIEFAKKLEERTIKFAIEIIKFSAILGNSPEQKVIRNQLTKSGTSIGANYREANRARSKADFKSKIRICEGEASETMYWLEIINDLGWIPDIKIKDIYIESRELTAIFSTISSKLNKKIEKV